MGIYKIKQHSKVRYLRCLLDETMSGEAIPLLHRKNSFLTQALKHLLCPVLIMHLVPGIQI